MDESYKHIQEHILKNTYFPLPVHILFIFFNKILSLHKQCYDQPTFLKHTPMRHK